MTHALQQPAGVGVQAIKKEVRALLPVWIACTLGVGAAAIVGDPPAIVAGVFACALGAIVIGAQSIGHEYSHRTLGLLLSQPCARRRTYLTKLGVLAGMLLALGAVAWIALFANTELARVSIELARVSIWHQQRVLLLAALCGLFVAPWLTMVCRGALPAMVFTVVIPLLLLALGDLIGTARYGLGGGADIDRFKLAVLWWGTCAVCAVAGISGWRMFMRLEATEGRGPEVHVPGWLLGGTRTAVAGASVVRRHHPWWLLAKKELHLQQMTFVVVALYILCWGTVSVLEQLVPEFPEIPVGPLSPLYCGLLSMLIGSLASAEERQFGTLEWHALLPMATWQQWAFKVGIALALAIVMAIGLPAALWFINAPEAGFRLQAREIGKIVVLLTTCSLYISSLSSSGVRALVLSLPSMLAALAFVRLATATVWSGADTLVASGAIPPFPFRRPPPPWFTYLLLTGFAALLLRFALVNHRSAERGFSRVWPQVVSIAGFLTLGVVLAVGYRVFSS